jgi:formamidopyrimidine-DNA glycosylase
MGGDVLYYASLAERTAADKIAVEVAFRDGGGVTIRFWWFGHVHLAAAGALGDHKPSAGIGPSPLSDAFTPGYLAGLCEGRRTAIKTVILDQRLLGGIGNVYGQDPLFHARIHPLQPARSLTSGEIAALHSAIRTVLTDSLRAGGLAYERDLYGKSGGYGPDRFAVAYREGKPCPACGNPIVKLKTGSTSTHICERCQVLRA